MPIWKFSELATVQRAIFPDMTEETLDERFRKVGGIPRFIFQSNNLDTLINNTIVRYVSLCNNYYTTFLKLIPNSSTSLDSLMSAASKDDVSHVLVHGESGPKDNFSTQKIIFASKYIRDLLLEKYQKVQKDRLFVHIRVVHDRDNAVNTN